MWDNAVDISTYWKVKDRPHVEVVNTGESSSSVRLTNSSTLFHVGDWWRGSLWYYFTYVVTNLSSWVCQHYVTVFAPQRLHPTQRSDSFVLMYVTQTLREKDGSPQSTRTLTDPVSKRSKGTKDWCCTLLCLCCCAHAEIFMYK